MKAARSRLVNWAPWAELISRPSAQVRVFQQRLPQVQNAADGSNVRLEFLVRACVILRLSKYG